MKFVRIVTRLTLPFGGMLIGAFGIYDMAWLGGQALLPGAVLLLASVVALAASVMVDKADQARKVDEKYVDLEFRTRNAS